MLLSDQTLPSTRPTFPPWEQHYYLDFILQNVSIAWMCCLGDMEKVLYHLQTVTYPDNSSY